MAFDRNSDLDIALGTGNWRGGASDGTTLWFVNNTDDIARAYVAATRARDSSKDIALGTGTWLGGTSDGTTLWFIDSSERIARAYVAATRARDSSKDIALGTGTWLGGTSDGTTLWFINPTDDIARAYVAATRARDSSKDIDLGDGNWRGGTSDGTTLWFTDSNERIARAYVAATRARDASKDISDIPSGSLNGVVYASDTLWFVEPTADTAIAWERVAPLEAVPAVIDGELSGEVEAQAQLGQAPALTATPEVIDGGLSGEVAATAELGEVPAAFPTVVDAEITVGEAAKWYSTLDGSPIDSFTGDLEVAPGFSIDRIWWTGSDFRLNRDPLGQRQEGDDNDFDEYFGEGGTGQLAHVYLVTDAGVAEIAVTSRRSIGPHYLNLTPDSDSQAIIEAVSVGDTVRFVIGPAGLSFVEALTATPAVIEGELSGEVLAAAQLGQAPALTAVPAVIDGDLSGEVVAQAALGTPSDALIATPAIIDGGLSGEVVAAATLGEEPTEFPTVVDAEITVGEAAKWYSTLDGSPIDSFTGDLEVAPGFSIDRIWWTGSDFRLNRDPLGQRQEGDDNDFDEYFGSGGTGENAYVYVITNVGVAEIAVTSRRSIGPHYLNLTPDADAQAIIGFVAVGDTVRFVIGPAGLSFPLLAALEAVPAIIDGELSGEVEAQAQLGQAPALTATPEVIDGELSGEVVAAASLGIPSDALFAIPAVIEGELSGEVVARATLGIPPLLGGLTATPAIIDGGLSGEVVARATLGIDPATIAARSRARADIFGLTGRKPIYALEVSHPSITDNIRIVNDTEDVSLEGNAYVALAFRPQLPQEKEGEIRQAGIEVDNVGRRMVEWVEASNGGRGATMRIMELTVSPTREAEVVWEVPNLDVGAASMTNDVLRVLLVDEGSSQAPAVKLRHDPVESPGLF